MRSIESKWQQLVVGQRIPDYGGKQGYLECFHLEPDRAIGYTSTRGNIAMTWVLTVWPVDDHTRVVIRLTIKTRRSKPSMLLRLGKIFDRVTIAGLAAGLNERLSA